MKERTRKRQSISRQANGGNKEEYWQIGNERELINYSK